MTEEEKVDKHKPKGAMSRENADKVSAGQQNALEKARKGEKTDRRLGKQSPADVAIRAKSIHEAALRRKEQLKKP